MPQRKAIRITGIVLACLMWTIPPGFGQEISRAEHERHIASLPEEQRTFQRFRFWFAALPESERQSDRKDQQGWHEALLGKYAAWLTAGGFTSGDVQKQITLLKKRGPADDAEFGIPYYYRPEAMAELGAERIPGGDGQGSKARPGLGCGDGAGAKHGLAGSARLGRDGV